MTEKVRLDSVRLALVCAQEQAAADAHAVTTAIATGDPNMTIIIPVAASSCEATPVYVS